MRLYHIVSGILLSILMGTPSNGKVLIDFTTLGNVNDWTESSDTVRSVGMSKAVLTLQKTQVFQRAIFFTLLNPQPNGAAFAGVYTPTNWDLQQYDELRIRCRAQGENTSYKIVLRHKKATINDIGYEQIFEVKKSNESFLDIVLPLKDFVAFYRGRKVDNAEPLNLAQITMFTIQIYGGVYSPIKQAGVSALEIENVQALKSNELPGN